MTVSFVIFNKMVFLIVMKYRFTKIYMFHFVAIWLVDVLLWNGFLSNEDLILESKANGVHSKNLWQAHLQQCPYLFTGIDAVNIDLIKCFQLCICYGQSMKVPATSENNKFRCNLRTMSNLFTVLDLAGQFMKWYRTICQSRNKKVRSRNWKQVFILFIIVQK